MSIRTRKYKNGKIRAYVIGVYRGKGIPELTETYKYDPSKTEKQNRKEAKRREEELKKKANIKDPIFSDYAEYAIKHLVSRGKMKPKTETTYRRYFLPRVNERFGDLRLNNIDTKMINKYYDDLLSSGCRAKPGSAAPKTDIRAVIADRGMTIAAAAGKAGISTATVSAACNGRRIREDMARLIAEVLDTDCSSLFDITMDNRPLAYKTVKEFHIFLSVIFELAYKEELIERNPVKTADPPKVPQKEREAFTWEELTAIINASRQESIKWQTVFALFYKTGMRRGEIAGLKWSAIDFDNSVIHVDNNLQYKPSDGLYAGSPKSDKSIREFPITDYERELLKEYRKWYIERKAAYGDSWHETGYIFFQEKTGNVGLPMHPDSINDHFGKFEKKYGLAHINPHKFRHTFATLANDAGTDPLVVSRMLGHSSVLTTQAIYTHTLSKQSRDAAEHFGNALNRALDPGGSPNGSGTDAPE